MTKAMPLPLGTRDRKCSKAYKPPAEAPMPTTGNEPRPGETAVSGRATLAGVFRRRDGGRFFFMPLFSACLSAVCFLRCWDLLDQVAQLLLTEARPLRRLAELIKLELSFHSQRRDPVRLE